MSKADPEVVEAVLGQVRAVLASARHRPVVIGICGAQGSGKSTLARALAARCRREGRNCAVLSLDDLYLTLAEREALAREVHPLLATRGAPGTHDVALGLKLLDDLESGFPTAFPRFDKAHDDRVPERDWAIVEAPCEVLVFEGWCLGAFPQPARALAEPINALEAAEDADGRWRRWVNDQLGDAYQRLFARIDRLILLAAPSFDVVRAWRTEQEHGLRKSGAQGGRIMDDEAISRFIAHYERITRNVLEEMPGRADLVVRLDEERRAIEIR